MSEYEPHTAAPDRKGRDGALIHTERAVKVSDLILAVKSPNVAKMLLGLEPKRAAAPTKINKRAKRTKAISARQRARRDFGGYVQAQDAMTFGSPELRSRYLP